MFERRLALAVATEQLAVADDAFALGADVDEDLVLVDADDLALDDVAVLEALDVRVLLGEELLHRRRLGAELARGRGLVLVVAGGRRIGRVVGAQRVARRRRRGAASSASRGVRRLRLVRRGGSQHPAPALAAASGCVSAPVAVGRLGGTAVASAPRRLRPTLASAWLSRRPSRRSPDPLCWVAGSSATATAATVSSDAWSAAEAMASGSGVVPPCCSSVKGLVTPGGGFAPENHERPERRSSRVRNDQVVRGDRLSAVRSFVRRMGSVSLFSCPAPWGRESLAHAFSTATIAAPCPNCPI